MIGPMSKPRYLRGLTLWVLLAAFIGAVVAFGVEVAWNGVLAMLFVACCLAWPGYLLVFRYIASRRPVIVDGGRLVQRNKAGQIVGTIDLGASFEARCLHDEGEWTLYRVKQGRQIVRLAVPLNADGRLVGESLGLAWPPPAPNPFRYLGGVVSVALLAASVAAAQSTDTSGWKILRDDTLGFEIKHPPGWRVGRSSGSLESVLLRGPSQAGKPGASMQLMVQRDINPGGLSIERWYAEQLLRLKPSQPPPSKSVVIAGRPGIRMDAVTSLGKRYDFYTAVHRSDVFQVAIMQDSRQAPLDPTLDAMLATLRLLE